MGASRKIFIDSERAEPWVMCLGLILLWLGLLFIYFQTAGNPPLQYDDPGSLSEDQLAKLSLFSKEFWELLLFEPVLNLWHPLTTLSHQLIFRVFAGFDSYAPHHYANILLHGGVATSWILVLKRLLGSSLLAVSAVLLFAWHPICVESVSWLSGRKDVLCAFFISLACWSYLKGWKGVALLLSAAAMLAKPVAVVMPLLFVLLDYCRSNKGEFSIKASIISKVPVFLASITLVLITVLFQIGGGHGGVDPRSIIAKVGGALWATYQSILHIVFPFSISIPSVSKLHIFYENPSTISYLAVLLLIFLSVALLTFFLYKKNREAVAGWSWFFVCILPTVGVVRAGNHLCQDRYSYLPLLGLVLVIAAISRKKPLCLVALSTLLSGCYLYASHQQAAVWKNDETLFAHALKTEPNNSTAMAHLAEVKFQKKDLGEAQRLAASALEIDSSNVVANLALGNWYFDMQEYQQAYPLYQKAIQWRSFQVWIYQRLAACAQQTGDMVSAKQYLEKGLENASSGKEKKAFQRDLKKLRNFKW